MATLWLYSPIVGDFSPARFNMFNNDPLVIPRNTDAALQGTPRPGVLKWALNLTNSDPTTNAGDDIVEIFVAMPFSADDYATNKDVLSPIVTIVPQNNDAYDQQVVVASTTPAPASAATGILTPLAPFVQVELRVLNNLAAALKFGVVIDFSHSSIN